MKGLLTAAVTEFLPDGETIRGLLDAGCFREARQFLDRLPPGQRDTAQARFLHGLCCLKLGELPEAISMLEKLVAQIPDNGYASHYLGLAGEGPGDIRRAAACFRRALELPSIP